MGKAIASAKERSCSYWGLCSGVKKVAVKLNFKLGDEAEPNFTYKYME